MEIISSIVFGLITERISESSVYRSKIDVEKEARNIFQNVSSILNFKGRIK